MAGTRSRGCPTPSGSGQAFGEFLEAVDPHRLPIHGGNATTLIVTIPLASLQADLATADLIGAGLVPVDTANGGDLTGDRITAAKPADSPAPRRSCPPSSAATASPSTSAAPAGSSAGPTHRHDHPRPDLSRRRL